MAGRLLSGLAHDALVKGRRGWARCSLLLRLALHLAQRTPTNTLMQVVSVADERHVPADHILEGTRYQHA